MHLSLLPSARSGRRHEPVNGNDAARGAVQPVSVPQRPMTGSVLRAAVSGVALVGILAACSSTGSSTTRGATTAEVTAPTTVATATVAPTTTLAPTTTSAAATTVAPATTSAPATTGAPATTMAAQATIARPTGLVDQFAIVAGSHMHVRCVGSGATTVILIAGFNGSGEIWGSIEAP